MAAHVLSRYATRRSPSTCRSHSSSWFQLTKMRLNERVALDARSWSTESIRV
jgi:hypothetical protein